MHTLETKKSQTLTSVSSYPRVLVCKDCPAAKASIVSYRAVPHLLIGFQTPSSPLPEPDSASLSKHEWPGQGMTPWVITVPSQCWTPGAWACQYCLVTLAVWLPPELGPCLSRLRDSHPAHRLSTPAQSTCHSRTGLKCCRARVQCEQTDDAFRMWENVITQTGASCQTHTWSLTFALKESKQHVLGVLWARGTCQSKHGAASTVLRNPRTLQRAEGTQSVNPRQHPPYRILSMESDHRGRRWGLKK